MCFPKEQHEFWGVANSVARINLAYYNNTNLPPITYPYHLQTYNLIKSAPISCQQRDLISQQQLQGSVPMKILKFAILAKSHQKSVPAETF